MSWTMTRAELAGLLLKDVPRPSLAKLRLQHKLDTTVRHALGFALRRQRRKDRVKSPKGQPLEGDSSSSGDGRARP